MIFMEGGTIPSKLRRFLPFDDCVKWVRAMGLWDSKKEWEEYLGLFFWKPPVIGGFSGFIGEFLGNCLVSLDFYMKLAGFHGWQLETFLVSYFSFVVSAIFWVELKKLIRQFAVQTCEDQVDCDGRKAKSVHSNSPR